MADYTRDYMSSYDVAPIAELNNGIILSKFEKNSYVRDQSYQTEAELEAKLIENLMNIGYERLEARTNEALYANLKKLLILILTMNRRYVVLTGQTNKY